MATLSQNDKAIYRAIEKIADRTEREVVRNYKIALDRIRGRLGRLYERYAKEGQLTYAQMSKYNRLKALHDNIVETVGPLFSRNGRLVEKLAEVSYEETFYRYEWAIDQEAGVHLNWGTLRKEQVEAAVQNPISGLNLHNLTLEHKRRTLLGINRAITQGLVQGDAYGKMARRVKDFLDGDASRATTVVRTEGQRAYSMAQVEVYDRAEELGINVRRVWDATFDSRTRESHAKLDGAVADEDGYFDTEVGRVKGPLQSGVPEFDINCMPGDVQVWGRPEVAYRRWYDGPLYTITTSVGMRLTVTVNHPILTLNGWRRAKSLKEGEYIIGGVLGEPSRLGDVDVEGMPTNIEKIFDTLALAGMTERVPGLASQFHGDGRHGYVDVVFADRELRNRFDATSREPVDELGFADAYEADPGVSPFAEFEFGTLNASHGIMGGRSEALALGRTGLGHAGEHSLTAITGSDAGLFDETGYHLAADAEAFCKGFNRDSFVSMEASQIDSIEVRDFSGHVYNLQTDSGVYYARDMDSVNDRWCVTHNCRCRVTPEIVGYEPKVRRIRDEGIQPYMTYSQWRKAYVA